MRISPKRKPKDSLNQRRPMLAAFVGGGAFCQLGFGSTELDEVGQRDPERIYDQLVSHVWECRTCWPWRNQLWAVHRLCPTGAGLADRYAVAEEK